MTKVIGLSGKKRRGKDTVYSLVKQQLSNRTVKRDAFADRLKISFARLFLGPGDQSEPPYVGWTDEEMIAFTDHFKERGSIYVPTFQGGVMPDGVPLSSWNVGPVSGREALQRYGTEMHRDVFGENFWVDQVLPPRATTHPSLGVQAAIHNAMLKQKYPGVDILVITDVRFPNEAERVREYGGVIWEVIRPEMDEAETDTHASETPLPRDLIDEVIVNDGSIEELGYLVEHALETTVLNYA